MSVELAMGLLGALTGIIALGGRAVDAWRARGESDGATMREAFKIAKHAREDTGQHVNRWADCEERCRELTEQYVALRAENEQLRKRINALEEQVRKLRAAKPMLDVLEDNRRRRRAQ